MSLNLDSEKNNKIIPAPKKIVSDIAGMGEITVGTMLGTTLKPLTQKISKGKWWDSLLHIGTGLISVGLFKNKHIKNVGGGIALGGTKDLLQSGINHIRNRNAPLSDEPVNESPSANSLISDDMSLTDMLETMGVEVF